ncbi:B12-binding domain-containing radical SAM protein [Candidatus Omnitrophota bacterium]
MGVATLSACLKRAGHQIELIHISNKIDKNQFIRRIRESNPSLIAFSFISNMWPQVKELTRWAKELNIPMIHGGLHPTIMPQEVINCEGVSILCIGEGEGAIIDLCDNMQKGLSIDGISNLWIKKTSGEIIKNPVRPLIENLDDLPFLDYGIFDYPRLEDVKIMKQLAVMASRGCPYQCTYCCNHLLKTLYPNSEHYVRFKSVGRLMEDIKHGLCKYPFLEIVWFTDDTLSLDKEWFLEFADRYSREINLPYICHARANQIDPQIADAFKKSRCRHIGLGIESGDEYIRNTIMKRNLSDQQILTAYHILKDRGIETTAFNILGAPSETMGTLLETVKLNAKADPNKLTNAYFYPYKGTVLFDICKEKGYRIKQDALSFFERPILQLNTVSEEQIIFAYNYFSALTRLYKKYLGFSESLSKKLTAKTDELLCRPNFPYQLFNRIYGVFDYFKRAIMFYAGKCPPIYKTLRFLWHKIMGLF